VVDKWFGIKKGTRTFKINVETLEEEMAYNGRFMFIIES